MSNICRWPALKLKMVIRLRQKTTTSTLSISSDRCSLALTRASRPFAGRLHHRSKRKRASGRLIADYEARPGFVSVSRVERTVPSHDVEIAQGYCLTLGEEMPATAAITMLARSTRPRGPCRMAFRYHRARSAPAIARSPRRPLIPKSHRPFGSCGDNNMVPANQLWVGPNRAAGALFVRVV